VNTGDPTIAAGVAGAANTDPSTMAS
jgi:hypothetical protein